MGILGVLGVLGGLGGLGLLVGFFCFIFLGGFCGLVLFFGLVYDVYCCLVEIKYKCYVEFVMYNNDLLV